jgi:hypothetical protein
MALKDILTKPQAPEAPKRLAPAVEKVDQEVSKAEAERDAVAGQLQARESALAALRVRVERDLAERRELVVRGADCDRAAAAAAAKARIEISAARLDVEDAEAVVAAARERLKAAEDQVEVAKQARLIAGIEVALNHRIAADQEFDRALDSLLAAAAKSRALGVAHYEACVRAGKAFSDQATLPDYAIAGCVLAGLYRVLRPGAVSRVADVPSSELLRRTNGGRLAALAAPGPKGTAGDDAAA